MNFDKYPILKNYFSTLKETSKDINQMMRFF